MIYGSPLRYVLMLAPLAFVFFFSFRINQMSASSARVAGTSWRICKNRLTGGNSSKVWERADGAMDKTAKMSAVFMGLGYPPVRLPATAFGLGLR